MMIKGTNSNIKQLIRGTNAKERVKKMSKFYCEAFEGYQVPKHIKKFSVEVCETFSINGICDPMYISNLTGRILGVGDGCHNFYEKDINKNNIDNLIERINACYGTCINGNYQSLENITKKHFV